MRKNETALEAFNTMPVAKAVASNVLPAMAAMLMVLVYNLADTFFIGQTQDALMVAAVSLVTPVFLLLMSVGTIFGVGGTSVISRALGEGCWDYARQVSSFCMWSCVLIGILMSLGLWLFMEPLLGWIGASADTWEMARTYWEIVIFSGPFVLIGNCFSNVLRAEGQPAKAMMGMLLGNLLNVVLDPFMILGLGWNIAGAAIATVIGNIVGAAYYLFYFWRGKSLLSIHWRDFTLQPAVVQAVLGIGLPASLGAVLMSVSAIVMNSHMASYGDMALAGIGVAIKVTMIAGMVCLGLGQGVQPLLGYCVGAKNEVRYQAILRFSLLSGSLLSLVLTVACYGFCEEIVGAFVTEPQAFSYGMGFARILLTTNVLLGVFFVLINALQAMGAAMPSLIINLSRQGLIYIPALYLLGDMFGVTGLVWAQPVADVLSFLLAIGLYRDKRQKLFKE